MVALKYPHFRLYFLEGKFFILLFAMKWSFQTLRLRKCKQKAFIMINKKNTWCNVSGFIHWCLMNSFWSKTYLIYVHILQSFQDWLLPQKWNVTIFLSMCFFENNSVNTLLLTYLFKNLMAAKTRNSLHKCGKIRTGKTPNRNIFYVVIRK